MNYAMSMDPAWWAWSNKKHGRRGRLMNEAADGPGRDRREGRAGREERRGGRRGGFGPFPPGPPFPPGFPGFGPGFGGPHGPGHEHHGPHGRGRARKGDVRLAILHLLAEQPRNGYQMIQELDQRTGGLWKPSPGAIYPALAALEDEGLIQPTGEGKTFALTEAGRQAVEASPTAPWTQFAEAGERFQASGAGALWQEFGQLAMALRAVSSSADASQLAAATELLGRTRRELFGLLAADPVEDEDGEADEA